MRNYITYILTAFMFCTWTELAAQNILNRVVKTVNAVENISRNEKNRQEKEANKPNTKSVTKTAFQKEFMGKIMFGQGNLNPNLEDASKFVQTLDLTQPSFVNAYLPDPLYVIKASKEKIGEYTIVSPHVIRNYYINNQLIATYSDKIEDEVFKKSLVLSDVFVPANSTDHENNKFRVAVLSHVFSTLSPGTHRLKVEYQIHINEPKPSAGGSAAIEYDNKTFTVATGEVDVKFTQSELDKYCRTYGRPKFDQGVLIGQPQLESQVKSLIQKQKNITPFYVFANDDWELERDYFNKVISRKVLVQYVYKNPSGRCEIQNLMIKQSYDGSSYYAPVETINPNSPSFKFATCQNYQ
jgi:hypothetical protein